MTKLFSPSTAVQTERLLRRFLELVQLDSPSQAEGPVREYIKGECHRLNLAFVEDTHGNLIITWPGHGHTSEDWYMVTGHMDVVPPCHGVKPVVEGTNGTRRVCSDGTTVLGADDKSALAAIFEAIEVVQEQQYPHPNLLFLITVEEEISLLGAKKMDPRLYQHAVFGIAFDHTGPQGLIVYEAPSLVEFELIVTGHSVHAGICPEHGDNAIQRLCKIIEQVPTGAVAPQTTFNWARVEGGKGTNIVPDRAVAQGEFRSHHEASLTMLKERLQAAVDAVVTPPATATLTFNTTFEHYRTDPDCAHVNTLKTAIRQAGFEPQLTQSNGASDINVFANQGLPGVVLSAGYVDPHALTEYVMVDDLVAMTRILLSTWSVWATSPAV